MKPKFVLTDYADCDNPVIVPFETLSQALAIMEESKTVLLSISDDDSTGEIHLEWDGSICIHAFNY
jgi:hypothetical protein